MKVRFMFGRENCEKHTRCDISINELFEKYDIEVNIGEE